MEKYGGHKCSELGCDGGCDCMNCHKCQKHHDEDLKREGVFV